MKLRVLSLCVFACTACAFDIDDFFDRLDTALTLSAFQDNLRVRLSGTLDLEIYHFEQPAPGLIDSDIDTLFNPRLTLFLDAQVGSHIYFFSQSRLDRGFDPSDNGAQVRLDEYALRVTPWDDGRLTVQTGKFATVVGNWVPRHLSWENPFINAPLVYENVTAIRDKSAPYSLFDFVYGPYYYQKYAFNPVIWGPSYASGISVSGLTRHGILVSQPARAHIFAMKPNLRFRPGAISAITGNLSSDKTQALPGVTYRCGSSFMKRVSKCPGWETQTRSLTTSKRNTSLRRSCSARFAGTSNSSATSVVRMAEAFVGVKTSRGLTWQQVTALHHIPN